MLEPRAGLGMTRSFRRKLVIGLYGGFLVFYVLALTDNFNHPEWLKPVYSWSAAPLLLGSGLLFTVCLKGVLNATSKSTFGEPRDERQEAAARRAYSLAYRILGTLVFVPGVYIIFGSLWFLDLPIPTSSSVWVTISGWLLFLVATLPKAVAAWLEPDSLEMEVDA